MGMWNISFDILEFVERRFLDINAVSGYSDGFFRSESFQEVDVGVC